MGVAGKLAKHIRDMGSVKNKKQVQTEEATKGQRTYREGQRKGAVIGGVAGAAAYGAAKEEKEKQAEKRMTEKEKEEISKKIKEKSDKMDDKKEMYGGGMVKKYAKGGVATKKMMGGGMAMKYSKGGMSKANKGTGMANCGASVKASGGSRNK
jgi:hypothetical protein